MTSAKQVPDRGFGAFRHFDKGVGARRSPAYDPRAMRSGKDGVFVVTQKDTKILFGSDFDCEFSKAWILCDSLLLRKRIAWLIDIPLEDCLIEIFQ